MAPHRNIIAWLERTYPKPRVDQEWLQGCCDWIAGDKGIHPERDEDEFTRQVELQLLSSELRDSMVPSSGLPSNIRQQRKISTGSRPVLVEITALTEIGHSAFSLLSTRQARLEREDLAGLVQREREQNGQDGSVEDVEEEGPIPNYPRQMLRLEVSDGTISLPAIEYRKIPDLTLGETQLGCKILLKDATVRNGIAFLEPSNAVVKWVSSHDQDKQQDSDFLRSLRRRMGNENPDEYRPRETNPTDSGGYKVGVSAQFYDEENASQAFAEPAALVGSFSSTASTIVPSRYFEQTTTTLDGNSSTQVLHRALSPVGTVKNIQPIDIADTSSDSLLALPTSALPRPLVPSAIATSSAGLSTRRRDEFDLSSDFIDEAFLDEVDKVEQAAIAASVLPVSTPQFQESTRATAVTRGDVIVIDDDDDECDDYKENIPAARASALFHNTSRRIDVIDLSE